MPRPGESPPIRQIAVSSERHGPFEAGDRTAPQFYLVTPPIEDAEAFSRELVAALDAADIAVVLLRLAPSDERSQINRVKTLAPIVQDKGVALLVDSHPEIVAHGGADGAHLTGIEAFEAALAEPQAGPHCRLWRINEPA